MAKSESDLTSLASGRITFDLDALAANWRALAGRLDPAVECGAVVKANAYGIGIGPAAKALSKAGARTFFVATPEEGLELRALLPDAVIYILNGLYGDTAPLYTESGLRPVLGSMAEVAAWQAFIGQTGQLQAAALHVDTGINRLGLSLAEAHALASAVSAGTRPGFTLVISHLACADTPEHRMNAEQLGRFREIASLFPDSLHSLANSAGILLGADYHFDLVRPGIALYGARASTGTDTPLRTVVTLEARLLATRDIPKGGTIGYGGRFTAKRHMRVGLLAIGYADGYLRRSGATDERPGASVAIRGHHAPVIGRVSMDQTAVDLTEFNEDQVKRGMLVEVLGPNVPVDDVAACADTIGYEFLTGLSRRFERRYIGGGGDC